MVPLQIKALDLETPDRELSRKICENLEISFDLMHFIAVVGPNGAGKTTLLKALVGLSHHQEGSILLYGKDIHHYSLKERAHLITYHAQNSKLYYDLNVRDLVLLGRTPSRKYFSDWSQEDYGRVEQVLEQVAMQDFINRGCFSLSGGELQRVFLARMLMSDAKILIIDEPTNSLDVGKAFDFLNLLQSLCQKGYLVICAMHDLSFVSHFTDRVLMLSSAMSWEFGDTNQLMKQKKIQKLFGINLL